MAARAVVVLGESLVDLVVDQTVTPMVAHPRYGGSPFNVAVGVARCGLPVSFVGPRCADFFGERLARFAEAEGIDLAAATPCPGQTCLAVAVRTGDSVSFDAFTRPEVLTHIRPAPPALVAAAAVVHTGSIALLADPARHAALEAFAVPGPCRTLDPNPRPAILDDPAAYRERLAPFLDRADVVKLSADDACFLYGGDPLDAARRLHLLRGAPVILTRGAAGARLVCADGELAVPATVVDFVDATGAGDAFMARVVAGIAGRGGKPPPDLAGWEPILRDAVRAAGLACASRGGAESMPYHRL